MDFKKLAMFLEIVADALKEVEAEDSPAKNQESPVAEEVPAPPVQERTYELTPMQKMYKQLGEEEIMHVSSAYSTQQNDLALRKAMFRIRKFMRDKKLSPAPMARIVGISGPSMYKLVRSETAQINSGTRNKVVKFGYNL